jgi:hypothetical protein
MCDKPCFDEAPPRMRRLTYDARNNCIRVMGIHALEQNKELDVSPAFKACQPAFFICASHGFSMPGMGVGDSPPSQIPGGLLDQCNSRFPLYLYRSHGRIVSRSGTPRLGGGWAGIDDLGRSEFINRMQE